MLCLEMCLLCETRRYFRFCHPNFCIFVVIFYCYRGILIFVFDKFIDFTLLNSAEAIQVVFVDSTLTATKTNSEKMMWTDLMLPFFEGTDDKCGTKYVVWLTWTETKKKKKSVFSIGLPYWKRIFDTISKLQTFFFYLFLLHFYSFQFIQTLSIQLCKIFCASTYKGKIYWLWFNTALRYKYCHIDSWN